MSTTKTFSDPNNRFDILRTREAYEIVSEEFPEDTEKRQQEQQIEAAKPIKINYIGIIMAISGLAYNPYAVWGGALSGRDSMPEYIANFSSVINGLAESGHAITYAHPYTHSFLTHAYNIQGIEGAREAGKQLAAEHVSAFGSENPDLGFNTLFEAWGYSAIPNKEKEIEALKVKIVDLPQNSFRSRILTERLDQYEHPERYSASIG